MSLRRLAVRHLVVLCVAVSLSAVASAQTGPAPKGAPPAEP